MCQVLGYSIQVKAQPHHHYTLIQLMIYCLFPELPSSTNNVPEIAYLSFRQFFHTHTLTQTKLCSIGRDWKILSRWHYRNKTFFLIRCEHHFSAGNRAFPSEGASSKSQCTGLQSASIWRLFTLSSRLCFLFALAFFRPVFMVWKLMSQRAWSITRLLA